MTSADTLMACDIAQLEELFAASKGNVEALRELEDELRYRGPQALGLLVRIQNLLSGTPAGPVSPSQPALPRLQPL